MASVWELYGVTLIEHCLQPGSCQLLHPFVWAVSPHCGQWWWWWWWWWCPELAEMTLTSSWWGCQWCWLGMLCVHRWLNRKIYHAKSLLFWGWGGGEGIVQAGQKGRCHSLWTLTAGASVCTGLTVSACCPLGQMPWDWSGHARWWNLGQLLPIPRCPGWFHSIWRRPSGCHIYTVACPLPAVRA